MTDYVVTGLVKRRAELTGEIERTHEDLRKMLADLEALDATLLMFAPDFQVEAIKPKALPLPLLAIRCRASGKAIGSGP